MTTALHILPICIWCSTQQLYADIENVIRRGSTLIAQYQQKIVSGQSIKRVYHRKKYEKSSDWLVIILLDVARDKSTILQLLAQMKCCYCLSSHIIVQCTVLLICSVLNSMTPCPGCSEHIVIKLQFRQRSLVLPTRPLPLRRIH